MRTPIPTGAAFGVFWLMLLVMFSSGLNPVSQLATYALLVAFIGFRRNHVIQWDDGSAVMRALTFGAALNFGTAGGAVVGALSIFSQNMDRQPGLRGKDLITKSVLSSASGAAAGFVYTWSSSIGTHSLAVQAVAVVASAVAYLAVSALTHFVVYSAGGFESAVRRAVSSQSYSSDLAMGFALAAVVALIHSAFSSLPVLLALPVVYLSRQLFSIQVAPERPNTDCKSGEMADVYMSAMHALVAAIDSRDRFTRMHTTNVVMLAQALGHRMGLGSDELEGLETAALFHDIGKLWVPEHILLKPGKLDQEQLAKIQCHPVLGQRILDNVNFPWSVGEIVRSHHERWDGTGYPDRLKGEEIPLGARILCLADVFDAMVSKRLYRPSNDMEETLRYIRGAAGTHFDPAVTAALDELIAEDKLPDVYKRSKSGTAKAARSGEAVETKSPADEVSVLGSEFVAVFEIAQASGASLELDHVLNLLANKIRGMISSSTCVIFLQEPDSNKLRSAVAVGDNAAYFKGAVTILGRGQTGMVAETGRGIIADYDGRDLSNPAIQKSRGKFSGWITPVSVLIAPIAAGEEGVIGTINLYQTQHVFAEEDLILLNAVAPEVGKAVCKSLLFQQTSESAVTDVITGLHNARYMALHLDDQLNLAKRLNRPLSVLYMDVDNFKTVNDVLGHLQGDQVLRDMAHAYRSQVRDGDFVCRYAGDEFVIILPGTDRIEALMTKRRIEVAVDSREPYGSGDRQVRVGVSIGVATYPEDGTDAGSLIACADTRMYAAKSARKGISEAA